jgi:predicted amidohydrolase YtcJ
LRLRSSPRWRRARVFDPRGHGGGQAHFARRISERAAHTPKGEWLLGGNWDETLWRKPTLPTRQLVDSVAADVPVSMGRYDAHMIVVNSSGVTSLQDMSLPDHAADYANSAPTSCC